MAQADRPAESCHPHFSKGPYLSGVIGETSVATPLLPMLLNMHDYNHQNGTHRERFRIEAIQFEQFIDEGYHSVAAKVVEQDADILNKLYQDQPQKIKLNNEIGMNWVRRNFKSWPAIAQPNLSR